MSYFSFASLYVSDCKTPRETTLPATITLHDLQTHLISTFFKRRNTLHLCSTFTFWQSSNSILLPVWFSQQCLWLGEETEAPSWRTAVGQMPPSHACVKWHRQPSTAHFLPQGLGMARMRHHSRGDQEWQRLIDRESRSTECRRWRGLPLDRSISDACAWSWVMEGLPPPTWLCF